jgi:hypothetical protein
MNKILFGDVLYIKGRIGWQALKKDEYLNKGDYYLVTGVDITDEHRIDFSKCYYVDKDRYELDDKICYPNVLLKPFNTEDESYRGSVIQVLTSTLEKLQKTEREFKKLPDGYYFVYLEIDKDLLLGKIHSDNLKALLQGALYKDLEKCIRLSKEEKIEGVMMYSLCTSSQY